MSFKTCKAKSRCWSMTVLYYMLDASRYSFHSMKFQIRMNQRISLNQNWLHIPIESSWIRSCPYHNAGPDPHSEPADPDPHTIPELFLPNICIYLKKKSLLIASLFPDSKQNFFDNGNFSSSSKGECGNSAPSADKCQGGQSPVRLGVGQGSLCTPIIMERMANEK